MAAKSLKLLAKIAALKLRPRACVRTLDSLHKKRKRERKRKERKKERKKERRRGRCGERGVRRREKVEERKSRGEEKIVDEGKEVEVCLVTFASFSSLVGSGEKKERKKERKKEKKGAFWKASKQANYCLKKKL